MFKRIKRWFGEWINKLGERIAVNDELIYLKWNTRALSSSGLVVNIKPIDASLRKGIVDGIKFHPVESVGELVARFQMYGTPIAYVDAILRRLIGHRWVINASNSEKIVIRYTFSYHVIDVIFKRRINHEESKA